LAVAGLKKLAGEAPVGWFSGRPSVNTRRLLVAITILSPKQNYSFSSR
jgi:hypothetical protein